MSLIKEILVKKGNHGAREKMEAVEEVVEIVSIEELIPEADVAEVVATKRNLNRIKMASWK